MKRAHKRIVGLLGLVFVAAMTIFAAYLPGPDASATSTVTDTITVKVTDELPAVRIVEPDSGDSSTSLDGQIKIAYDNLSSYTLTLKYTKNDGTEGTTTIATSTSPAPHGEETFDFRSFGETYGYGRYTITLTGTGTDGSEVEDAVEYDYVAVESSASEDSETGSIYVDLEYDTDDPGVSDEERVDTIEINVYDENGDLVEGLSPIKVKAPTDKVEIPFDDPSLDLPSGNYTIVVKAYNSEGEELYKTQLTTVYYEKIGVPSTAVPDTGNFFQNLNISRTDYLLTGLGVFTLVGIGGVVFVSRRGR